MSSPALSLEATTIHIEEEIEVRASIEVTFAALLDQLGPYNETQVDRPMPMKLEAWPGGRGYRDLGDNNGHYLGNGAGDQEDRIFPFQIDSFRTEAHQLNHFVAQCLPTRAV